jgi:hypothetical protein
MESLERRILGLSGVEKGKSRFGPRAAYRIEGREFVHLHGPRELDLRLTRAAIRELRETLRGDPRVGFRSGPSDWVSIAVAEARDVEFAFALVEEAWRANQ